MIFPIKNKKNSRKFSCPKGLRHLAIIMDGNGRWAKKRACPRYFGHLKGVQSLKAVIQSCSNFKIPYLSVFAFSTENWKRSSLEVTAIMKLMEKSLIRYRKSLNDEQIRLHFLGDITELTPSVQKLLKDTAEDTKNNKGLNLIIAVNYGGRREMVQGVKKVVEEIKAGRVQVEQLSESLISQYLPSSLFPPPDLIIRTGGVSRLSNFYLWSAAYSEFYVSPLLWPDFTEKELIKALKLYSKTQRRFGGLLQKYQESS